MRKVNNGYTNYNETHLLEKKIRGITAVVLIGKRAGTAVHSEEAE